jgi:uncharacterized protein YjiS (DUF1127 family)
MFYSAFDTFALCISAIAGGAGAGSRTAAAAERNPSLSARLLRAAGRSAARAWRASMRWNERQALHRHLAGLDDHLLADIGLRRDQIPLILAGFPLDGSPRPARPGVVRRAVARLKERVASRRLHRELSALDDRMLADIGIRRADIPTVLAERLRAATPNPTRPWQVPAPVASGPLVSTAAEDPRPSRALAA